MTQEYKKAGTLEAGESRAGGAGTRFRYHGVVAGLLMIVALVVGFGYRAMVDDDHGSKTLMYYLGAWVSAKLLWIWACTHLAMCFRLSPVWGLWGILFLVGLVVILWGATQRSKWEMMRARAAQRRGSAEREDSDSLY